VISYLVSNFLYFNFYIFYSTESNRRQIDNNESLPVSQNILM